MEYHTAMPIRDTLFEVEAECNDSEIVAEHVATDGMVGERDVSVASSQMSDNCDPALSVKSCDALISVPKSCDVGKCMQNVCSTEDVCRCASSRLRCVQSKSSAQHGAAPNWSTGQPSSARGDGTSCSQIATGRTQNTRSQPSTTSKFERKCARDNSL